MPPARRPAAAVSRRVLRRPAAAEDIREDKGLSPVERFQKGENVELIELPFAAFKVGQLLVFDSASYFGGDCKFAGRFRELCQVDHGHRLRVHLTGTTHSDLLAYATGTLDRQGEVHVCDPSCKGELHSPGLMHARLVRLVAKEKEASLEWELNLESHSPDELEELRKKQQELERRRGDTTPTGKKDAGERKRSRSKKKKEKKKKKKKKKKKRESCSRSESSNKSKEEKDRRRKKRKYGGRTVARKELSVIYGGTGLDPRPRVRRKVMRYARRKTRRKTSTSSSTSRSSSDSGDTRSSEQGEDMLQESNKIRSLHRYGPGVLTAMGVGKMREAVVELEGNWNEETTNLPPIALKYLRSTLQHKLSGGALREAMTLASLLDLLMMGRISESADLAMQRLKAIEKVAQGASWASTEKLELIGAAAPQIATRGELSAAAKDLKLDQQSKGSASPYKGKGGVTFEGKGKKGRFEDKGRGKKGGEQDKGAREKREK